MKVALSSGGQNQNLAKPLKDQAFATPDKVAELAQKVACYSLELCMHYSFIGQHDILFWILSVLQGVLTLA